MVPVPSTEKVIDANIFSIIPVLDKIRDKHEGRVLSELDSVMDHMQNLLARGLSESFNIFICFTCPKFATSLKELQEHTLTTKHKDMVENENGPQSDWLRCEICAKLMPGYHFMENHCYSKEHIIINEEN